MSVDPNTAVLAQVYPSQPGPPEIPATSAAEAKLDEILSLLRQHMSATALKAARTPREKKPAPDPLAELVDVIRTVKEAKGLPFDEAVTRGKLADAAFRRAAKKEPNVAAELLRRKEAAGGAAASDTLATL